MHYEHFAFIVNFLHFCPTEMVCFSAALEGQDPKMIDTKIKFTATLILGNSIVDKLKLSMYCARNCKDALKCIPLPINAACLEKKNPTPM